MKMNLRRQNFGQNVSRTFTKAVYPEKNGVKSACSNICSNKKSEKVRDACRNAV